MVTYKRINGRVEFDDNNDFCEVEQMLRNLLRPVVIDNEVHFYRDVNVIEFDGNFSFDQSVMDSILDLSDKYMVVKSCTDNGVFVGYLYDNGCIEKFDLREWGENKFEYKQDEVDIDWRIRVENDFIKEHSATVA